MFKEVFYLIPKITTSAASAMENSLNSRFAKVAKKFGKGIFDTIKGGGYVGAAIALVDKLLNPLKEVQDAIDRTLHTGDDLVTQAAQFNSTAGELAKLQAFGKSQGLDASGVNLLVEKFQSAVAEAQVDPNKNTSVRNFVGRKDTVQAFFDFVQEMQKLNATQKNQVQQEVFGEKQILKASQFLNADFGKLDKQFQGVNVARLTKDAEKVDNLNQKEQTKQALQDLQDFHKKANLINDFTIDSRLEKRQNELNKENKALSPAEYQKLVALEEAGTKLSNTASEILIKATAAVVQITDLSKNVDKLLNSSWLRRLGFGKGDK